MTTTALICNKKQTSVADAFSTGLTHVCTSCEHRPGFLLCCALFSRVDCQQIQKIDTAPPQKNRHGTVGGSVN